MPIAPSSRQQPAPRSGYTLPPLYALYAADPTNLHPGTAGTADTPGSSAAGAGQPGW